MKRPATIVTFVVIIITAHLFLLGQQICAQEEGSSFWKLFDSQIGQALIDSNDALAQATLRTLSTACETYATVHTGYYPTTMSALTDALPPYLVENYCNQTIKGFTYSCVMTNESYQFTAIPESIGVSGSTIYSIRTGGILVSEE